MSDQSARLLVPHILAVPNSTIQPNERVHLTEFERGVAGILPGLSSQEHQFVFQHDRRNFKESRSRMVATEACQLITPEGVSQNRITFRVDLACRKLTIEIFEI
jgi:hypothetical protein